MGSLVEHTQTLVIHIVFFFIIFYPGGVGVLGTSERYYIVTQNKFQIMIQIHNDFIPFRGYKAMTLLCFIFVRNGFELDEEDIRHESIHWEQQKEMLILPFFLWYLIEFIVNLFKFNDWSKAYRNISFEREAYDFEKKKYYLEWRKRFAWFNYLSK